MVSENNKRIAKNTALLYVRTLFSQIIALYASRKVLEILGVEDFGINNVVGGVVGMLTFLNGSMAVATQRYLTIELGRKDMKAYNKIFSMAYIIHIVLAILICILAETLGLWFVNHGLNIPSERMIAANWIYQLSVLSVAVGIMQTPYVASLTAHECMNVYAYMGMGEAVLRLLIVFLLWIIAYDKLIVYGILLFCVVLVTSFVYHTYCVRLFDECKFKWQWDKGLFRSLLGFTGWNLFGTIAWILKDQGVNVVMNIFGGPLINAARGVAYQVSNAIQNLVNGFSSAVGPQLTKNYAADNKEGLHRLMMISSKISFFLLLLVALPIMIEVPYLLHIWLVEVPEYAVVFTRLILLDALCATFGSPMITGLLATGHIKWYQIVVGSIMLLNVPLSYGFLYAGFPMEIPFVVSIFVTLMTFVARLWFCKHQLALPIKVYLHRVILPALFVSLVAVVLPIFVSVEMETGLLRLLSVTSVSIISVTGCIYLFGLTGIERNLVNAIICNQWKRFKR